MTAREIFNQCVEEQLFGTCINIEIKKHSNLAKAHPKGEIHYYRQVMWDIQQELSTHTLFNSWASCGYGRMFGENGANANVFDWIDHWMQKESLEQMSEGYSLDQLWELRKCTEERYADLFRSFLPDYVCFHWLNEQLNNAINKSEWSKCLRSDSKIIKAYLAIEEELYEQGYIKDGCWEKDIATLQELLGTLRDNRYFQNNIRGGKALHSLVQARFKVEDKDLCRLEEKRIDDIMAKIKRNRRLKNINIKPQ